MYDVLSAEADTFPGEARDAAVITKKQHGPYMPSKNGATQNGKSKPVYHLLCLKTKYPL